MIWIARSSSLYAGGMTTRDITDTFKEMYDTLVSEVTECVMEEVITWQNWPLDSVYPPLFLGCIVVKVREDKRVINKSVYLALAINLEGRAARPVDHSERRLEF